MSTDAIIFEYKRRVLELRDWPDRDIINALTKLSREYINLAHIFTDVIVRTLIDSSTFSSYKKPLFYLIDSLMKNVGGPYAAFFTKQFADVYDLTVKDLPDEDRTKLNFLFGTWEERNFFPSDLLVKMKYQLMKPRNVAPQYHSNVPMTVNNNIRRTTGFPVDGMDRNSILFQDLVRNEMNLILNQMYSEMKVTNPLTIDEIAVQNPQLFANLKLKAEESAVEIFHSRANLPQLSLPNNTAYVSSHSSLPRDSQLHSMTMNQQSYRNPTVLPDNFDRTVLGKRSYAGTSHVSQPPVTHARIHDTRSYPETKRGSDGYASNQQQARISSKLSSPGTRNRAPSHVQNSSHNINNNFRTVSQSTTSTNLFDNHVSSSSSAIKIPSLPLPAPPSLTVPVTPVPYFNPHQHSSLLANRNDFTEGKASNTPIVLDVSRIRHITQQLHDHSSSNNSMSRNLTPTLQNIAAHLYSRINSTLSELNTPVALPPLLFGQMPMHLVAMKSQPQSQLTKVASRGKMQLNNFKMSDLSNNPEIGIRKLYQEYGHQFREDGIRFKDLGSLQKHSDLFFEKKKLLLKKREKKDTREGREWYCNLSQWVTDFSQLSMGGKDKKSGISGGDSNPSMGSTEGSNDTVAAEEFVIPADEDFISCPISKEVFENFFDDEEGELMYRNAVKVLVTPTANTSIYHLGKPVPLDMEEDKMSPQQQSMLPEIEKIHYMIVNKPLVMDKWLQEERAMSLRDALIRYNVQGKRGKELAMILKTAAGEEDEDDIFVIIEMLQ